MIRSLAPKLVLFTSLLAAPVLAQDAKPTLAQACKTTAIIADRVVTLRKEGTSRNRAERLVVSQLTEDAQRFLPAVYMTLDWAYALPEEALDADIQNDWETQCLAAGQ